MDLFKNHGPNIFKSSWHSGFTNYFRAKYSPDYLEQILGEKLGDTTLADMYTATALMAFNITTDSSYAFRSWKADKERHSFYAKHVARATSAAPTFFPPASVSFLATDQELNPPQLFLDGGVASNNPSLVALGMATTLHFGSDKVEPRTMNDIFMVSLGTGKMYKANEYTKQRGLFSWAKPISEVFLRGDSQEVDYTLHDLSMAEGCPKNFVRINPFLGPPEDLRLNAGGIKPEIQAKIRAAFSFNNGKDTCHEDMDVTTKANLDNLEKLGTYCAQNVSQMLELKLPNCQAHGETYADVTLEFIASQLIANKAEKKIVQARVNTHVNL